MINVQETINLVNAHPETTKKALDAVSKGRVFVVHLFNSTVYGCFKTRKGAEGYINRYTVKNSCVGESLEIVEISENQIKDITTDKDIWNNLIQDNAHTPHMLPTIVDDAKQHKVNPILVSWIEAKVRHITKTEELLK